MHPNNRGNKCKWVTNIFLGHKDCLYGRSQGWAVQSPYTGPLWTPSPDHNWNKKEFEKTYIDEW